MKQPEHTNALIYETSPYLLQHAHNPVNWQPWGENALNQAKAENKLLLISIGYSACHWCHVMEHESFEDPEVAQTMNDRFVCIKVDREERPDVDHIYMTAVQLMTGRGGWPLNCIALPDGRPVWGGTYFPKSGWLEALNAVADFYAENPEKTLAYARQLQHGIEQNSLVPVSNQPTKADRSILPEILESWKSRFDTQHGGTKGAPKFMMPNNGLFLLRAGIQLQEKSVLDQVKLTLLKMAFGGIYDQIGGGFARYSTDEIWKVPHFEKMLYDNAQLLTLYSEAYKTDPDPLYKQVVSETIDFLRRELLSPENGFYSALDADSEGEEGKFYVWQKAELLATLGDESDLFCDYYNINQLGYWEHNQYILMRTEDDQTFAANHQISVEELGKRVENWKTRLLAERSKRVRPGLDDKILTSWNALTIEGLLHAFTAFENPDYLELALANANFLNKNLSDKNGHLFHAYKNKQARIPAFLEDYAFVIEAFTTLFEATAEKIWLDRAAQLTEIAFQEFFDAKISMFYFSGSGQIDLITRTLEIHDNVIPASNSAMAKNLFRLSYLLGKPEYGETARKMLETISGSMSEYPSGYSNWSQLLLNLTGSHYEVALVGPDAVKRLQKLQKHYLPQVVFCAGIGENELPLLQNRYVPGKTLIYVCRDNSCQLPVETAEEALNVLREK